MSVQRVDFYKVACDHPACTISTADLGEFAAWGEPEHATGEWTDSGRQELRYDVIARVVPEVTWLTVEERTTHVLIHLCDEHAIALYDEDDGL